MDHIHNNDCEASSTDEPETLPCDVVEIPCSDSPCLDSPCLDSPHTPNKLAVLLKDLYTDSNCQSVNLAVVSNYTDDKDETQFSEIRLGEIKITYDTLVKIFFNDIRKGFSSHVLGKIWRGIKNFSLASVVFEKFEEQTGIDVCNISPSKKVKLHKECAFSNLNTIIKKSFGLTLSEFLVALGSVDVREDCNISANIMINLFFPSLDIGVRIVMRFAVSDVPKRLIGKISCEDELRFDFSDCCDDNVGATIVFCEPPRSPCHIPPISPCHPHILPCHTPSP